MMMSTLGIAIRLLPLPSHFSGLRRLRSQTVLISDGCGAIAVSAKLPAPENTSYRGQRAREPLGDDAPLRSSKLKVQMPEQSTGTAEAKPFADDVRGVQ